MLLTHLRLAVDSSRIRTSVSTPNCADLLRPATHTFAPNPSTNPNPDPNPNPNLNPNPNPNPNPNQDGVHLVSRLMEYSPEVRINILVV